MDHMKDIAESWMCGDARIEKVVFQNNYAPMVIMKGNLSDYAAEKRRKESGVVDAAKELTIDTYEPKTAAQRMALEKVREYFDTFKSDQLPRKPKNGLFITGSNGTGKTYLTFALANSLMKRFDLLMGTTAVMNDKMRRADFEEGATTNRAKDKYKFYDILIIDDIGKQKLTEYQLTNLFEIIDYRSSNLMPTIFTSNYGGMGLLERLTPDGSDKSTSGSIIDRINGMCSFVEMKGESLRR